MTACLSLELAFFLRAIVSADLEGWTPLLQLRLPVEHHAGWHHSDAAPRYLTHTTPLPSVSFRSKKAL